MAGSKPPPVSLPLERFKKLPLLPEAIIRGRLVRYPEWVRVEGDELVRPWLYVWMAGDDGPIMFHDLQLDATRDFESDFQALVRLATDARLAGYRPGLVEVGDETSAAWLRQRLAEEPIDIRVNPDCSHLVGMLADMEEKITGRAPIPGLGDTPGVTPELLRRFANAAFRFHAREPWRDLTELDLWRVEGEVPEPWLRHGAVMGAGGELFGLAFYAGAEDHEALLNARSFRDLEQRGTTWNLTFERIFDLPIGDADVFEALELPTSGARGWCPMLIGLGPGEALHRPGRDALAFVSRLLEALGRVTEAQLDGGRWTDRDEAGSEVTLALPALLDPALLASEDSAADLARRASRYEDRRGTVLLREALRRDPDCTEAFIVLAQRSEDSREALAQFEAGVAAGRRALGPDFFTRERGRFGTHPSARPFMLALQGQAECLDELGQYDAECEVLGELLALDEPDEACARYNLVGLLVRFGRTRELAALLDRFDDPVAIWDCARAIHAFLEGGDTPRARQLARAAFEANPWAAKYLLGKKPLPARRPPYFASGTEEDAIYCAFELREPLRAQSGARAWIGEIAAEKRKARKQSRKK